MRAFRMAAVVLVAGLVLGACGGDDDHGVTASEPIGAPEDAASYDTAAGPTVAKTASIDVEVPRSELGDSAQAVVDLATSPKIGGFLVSSVLDLEDGYGSGAILVEVPTDKFEQSVAELSGIGELTRQEMSGADWTADVAAARTKAERRRLRAETAYSPIDVALEGRRPPPAPAEPPLERALGTAKAILLAVASAGIVAGGAAIPVVVVLLALYLAWSRIARRLRVRPNG
jgi:hypothetical protein